MTTDIRFFGGYDKTRADGTAVFMMAHSGWRVRLKQDAQDRDIALPSDVTEFYRTNPFIGIASNRLWAKAYEINSDMFISMVKESITHESLHIAISNLASDYHSWYYETRRASKKMDNLPEDVFSV